MLKQPFGRIGSKQKIRKKLYTYFPNDFKTYVEPFVGGGSVFFGYDFNDDVKTVINDLDVDMYEGHSRLKKGIQDFKDDFHIYDVWKDIKRQKEWIEENPPPYIYNGSELYKGKELDPRLAYQKLYSYPTMSPLMREIYDAPTIDDLHALVKLRILSNCTFGNRGRNGKVHLYAKNNEFLPFLERCIEYEERLKNTDVLNEDYKKVIERYDDIDTFFYLDPPYEITWKAKTDVYNHGNMNLIELQDVLSKIKGRFVLSLNDSPAMRELFKDFHIDTITAGVVNFNAIGGIRSELIIKNF